MLDLYRIACAVPDSITAGFENNISDIMKLYTEAAENNASIVLFPADAVSGCGCSDVANFPIFRNRMSRAIDQLAGVTAKYKSVMVITGEFSEPVVLCGGKAIFVNDTYTVFTNGSFSFTVQGRRKAFEQTPNPGRADLMLFPYSGTDTFHTVKERRMDYQALSRTFNCYCAACGASPSNTTGKGVCGGHAIVTGFGRTTAENVPFETKQSILYCDIDADIPQYLDRSGDITSREEDFDYLEIDIPQIDELKYCRINRNPFLPEQDEKEYLSNIVELGAMALAVRMKNCGIKKMVLGISGGLDSTMALLICNECCKKLALPPENIIAVSMPGFGTENRTRDNSVALAEALNADLRIIPIADAVNQHFKDIGHDPANTDVVYENSQARERTQILMDIANQSGGLVIGTGDLSEIALGWCTFNGDHMAMYSVNASIPKTLMRLAVSNYAASAPEVLAGILIDICDTPISPELVPGKQYTEEIIGSYDLHDFFLYYFVRYGVSPVKLFIMAKKAFQDEYTPEKIYEVMKTFFTRFFRSQFKRAVMPEAPDLTGIELSRFQMPSDISDGLWKKELEYLKDSDYLK